MEKSGLDGNLDGWGRADSKVLFVGHFIKLIPKRDTSLDTSLEVGTCKKIPCGNSVLLIV